MPIVKLPPLLVNQIAAGEVIERPASVVKELVENSLDAGATRIDVAIEDGGRQLIRVSDDGKGIAPEELPLAVAPHATSKLATAEQLAAVATLGFRGEALASIASVSRLRIASRSCDDQGQLADAGAALEAAGEQVGEVRPAAGAPGTVIEIRDLFFNTPARRKFMRSAPTEFGYISDTITRIAMVHPEVSFRLSHNDRKTLDLPPETNRLRRAVALLGKEIEEGLLEFEREEPVERGGASVWGLAGLPALARSSSKFQYLCVNGRPVRDRNLAHAVKEAYRGLMPPDKQPVAVVFLEVAPGAVDVNVHPAKAEVRFREPGPIHGLILAALRQRLLASDLTPSGTLTASMNARVLESSQHGGTDFFAGNAAPASGGDVRDDTSRLAASAASGGGASGAGGASGFVDYFRRMDPKQKGFVYQQVRQAMAEHDPSLLAAADQTIAAAADTSGGSGGTSGVKPHHILQVHQSYVVTQDEDGLLIVDQHALHERVMFEELRQRVLGHDGDDQRERTLESQRLLMPVVLNADAKRQALLEELEPLLTRIGIEASPMGPNAVGIQAFPTFLFDRNVEPIAFMEELLDKAEAGELEVGSRTVEEAVLHEVLDMMACKAAVKAGDRLSEAELAALLAKRDQIERASNCPHGRPTTIRLTLRDLEKQFKRT